MRTFAGVLTLLLALAVPGVAGAQDVIAIARQPGIHLLMRHAIAPGVGDPANMDLADCATQRNLSKDGRRQAARIGERLNEAGIAVDVVLTSAWCRARETAERLGVAPVETAPFLNSFFADRSGAAAQSAAARARLGDLDAAGAKAVLVTHQVNITALTGVYPASGEIVLIRVGKGGRLAVEGRLAP
ncbi:histidine phosphatase family protein [Methylobrevis pamukkalensis]|uniref:Histidine phosphatase superfamily (Branch 1) n=1 Tax=Methylobrevis pamukkalensis TaxID=1439726 RepID=A0A1E3H4M9_9HYPH|nr:histidine phosphatase family protein [Methylobrevis pamukkalensis]ODN71283.1 hypothetical protein A6302_01398 [Methylobrevis pamukkalensis]